MPVTLCVIGHLTIDEVRRRGTVRRTVGGTAFHSSATAAALGLPSRVVSKVGADYPRDYVDSLRARGVDTTRVRTVDGPSTSFSLTYGEEGRVIRLVSKCEDIELGDVAGAVDSLTIAHIGPVAGEVPLEVIEDVAARARLTSLDLQGILRSFAADGSMTLVRPPVLLRALRAVNVVHCDTMEAAVATGRREPARAALAMNERFGVIALVTDGARGSYVAFDRKVYRLPAASARAVDETGAGDAYVAAFLHRYERAREVLTSAAYAAAVSSIKVETGTVPLILHDVEITARMGEIVRLTRRVI